MSFARQDTIYNQKVTKAGNEERNMMEGYAGINNL